MGYHHLSSPHPTPPDASPTRQGWSAKEEGDHPLCGLEGQTPATQRGTGRGSLGHPGLEPSPREDGGKVWCIPPSCPFTRAHTHTHTLHILCRERRKYSPEQVRVPGVWEMTSGRKHAFSHQLLWLRTRAHTHIQGTVTCGCTCRHVQMHSLTVANLCKPEPKHTHTHTYTPSPET